jgi:hypothetical protein
MRSSLTAPRPRRGTARRRCSTEGAPDHRDRGDHAPIAPACAYRFDYKDRSVLVTGDLKFHRSLVTAARDVDVLVSDAISLMMTRAPGTGAGNAGRDRTAAIMHDIEDYHITPEQAAQVANDGREPASSSIICSRRQTASSRAVCSRRESTKRAAATGPSPTTAASTRCPEIGRHSDRPRHRVAAVRTCSLPKHRRRCWPKSQPVLSWDM